MWYYFVFCICFRQTTNGIHIKPNPRPRCVVKANSVVTSTTLQPQMPPPASPPKPAAKPEIVPRSTSGISNNNQNNNKLVNKTKDDTNEHNAKNLDCVDEGLAMLRRQPSIKDRRKVWWAQCEKFKNSLSLETISVQKIIEFTKVSVEILLQ